MFYQYFERRIRLRYFLDKWFSKDKPSPDDIPLHEVIGTAGWPTSEKLGAHLRDGSIVANVGYRFGESLGCPKDQKWILEEERRS